MTLATRNSSRLFYIAALLLTLTFLSGCSINARQFAWSAYENRDASIDKWVMLTPRTERSLLLATYASTHYTRSNQLAYDSELISRDTPVILAWIEFSEVDQPIPLYRYIIQPLKAITAEELLLQGKYITNNTHRIKHLPAKTPSKVTNGAVVTDWQYCYDCIVTLPLEQLNPANISYLREEFKITMARKPLAAIAFFNDPKEIPYLKSRSSMTVYSGDEARQQQALLADHVAGLSGAISEAKKVDELYRQFTKNEHKPLTFEYLAEKAGCPKDIANPREINGDRRSQSNTIIRINLDYIECNSEVLERYDIAPYLAKYEQLVARENTLWERSSKKERHSLTHPERTINGVLQSIDMAKDGIESAYSELDLADKLDARNRQLEAFGQQNWANTLNGIQARNDKIRAQYQQTQKMIQNAKRSQYKPSKKQNETKTTRQPSQAATSTPKPGAAAKSEENTSQASATPSTPAKANSSSQAADSSATASTAPSSSSPMDNQAKQATKKPNNYVGSGRDYPFSGTSGQFFKPELSEELARLNLMNQASDFCGSGMKTEIRWSDVVCEPSVSEKGKVRCSVDGLVNCYENLCDVAYCGTAPED